MPLGYGERTVSRGYDGVQVYALSRLGYKTEAVISSVAPAHPRLRLSPLRFFVTPVCDETERDVWGDDCCWLHARR